MKCPYCGYADSRVIDSRPYEDMIRRRRECVSCLRRFTTYETVEKLPVIVIKKDGRRETFDRVKLMNGIVRACEKRLVPLSDIEKIVANIEQELESRLDKEVPSSVIGEMVMDNLKKLDEVAYVRFASVYRQFKDINTFMDELTKLINDKDEQRQ